MIQRVASAIAGVVHFAADSRSIRRFQAQSNHVLHIGEIASLLTVAEDDRRAPFNQSAHEQRQHARVRAGRILPLPIHIEETQRERIPFPKKEGKKNKEKKMPT